MKKYISLGIALLMAACAPKEGWEVTLKGKVRFPDSAKSVFLQRVDSYSKLVGEKQIIEIDEDGAFEAPIRLKEPGYYQLNFYDAQKINLIVDRSDFTVEVDGNAANGAVDIKGSPDRDLIVDVQEILQAATASPGVKALEGEYAQAVQNKDREKMEALKEQYMNMLWQAQDKAADLIRQQGPSLAVINLLSSGIIDADRYADLYTHVAQQLKQEWPEYAVSKEFIAYVKKRSALTVGNPAPEITLPNPDGEIVTLSSFRGKYVLVDFWAQWCGPCRQENPNVVRAYRRYNDKGFEVLGVSLDSKKSNWLQAIEEDGLVWTQVSDLKSFESPVVEDYQITGIPMSVLVGPDGNIVAKGLRGKELENRLQALFGS